MTAATTRRVGAASYAVLALGLAFALVPSLAVSSASAAGRTITISITADGPKPASTTAQVGDTIAFQNTDMTFVHEVGNKTTNWPTRDGTFDSGPLAPGQIYTVGKLTKPGEYDYQGTNLDSFTGKVVVPGTTASAAPAPSASPAPQPSTAPAPGASASPASPASPSASPAATGGTGVVGPPPLSGGFGTIGVPGSPAPGGDLLPPNVAPNVAPTLPGEDAATPEPSATAVAIGGGYLPEPPTGRRYGLPAALAAIAALGVASLLVRVLLAHPAAQRSRLDRAGRVQVTVD